MKELVEVIAKSLVDYPDEVVVTETENEKAIVLELRVAQSDMGKVIGKQGRIAKAIRAVVKAAASKEEKKVIVEIMHNPTPVERPYVLFPFVKKCEGKPARFEVPAYVLKDR